MSTLASAWALVFVMNAVTFPLPPAWTVMAVYHATARVPLLPLTLGGSAAAALGRAVFAWLVARFTDRLPADARRNALALSAAAHRRLRWPWMFVVLYSFLPVSSDPVFVAVGIGALPWRSSIIAFWLARSVFNTLMVAAAQPVASDLGDLFAGRFGWESILVVAASVGGYVLLLKLPWTRWLGIEPSAAASTPAHP
jgi:membrane protein YqaA with SNARE-associated domain